MGKYIDAQEKEAIEGTNIAVVLGTIGGILYFGQYPYMHEAGAVLLWFCGLFLMTATVILWVTSWLKFFGAIGRGISTLWEEICWKFEEWFW